MREGGASLQGRSGRVTLLRTKVVVMGWIWRGTEDTGRRAERVREGRRIALDMAMAGLIDGLIYQLSAENEKNERKTADYTMCSWSISRARCRHVPLISDESGKRAYFRKPSPPRYKPPLPLTPYFDNIRTLSPHPKLELSSERKLNSPASAFFEIMGSVFCAWTVRKKVS